MGKKHQSKSGSKPRYVKKRPGTTIRKRTDPSQLLCSCDCGRPAEVTFGDDLAYTRECFQRTVDELRAAGVPIEQSEAGVRLNARVTFVDDGDPSKVH